MKTIASLSFHELPPPPTDLNRSKSVSSSLTFAAKNFVTQRSGRLSDAYEIGEKLGSGGYGEVYSCTHKQTNIERAVKILQRGDQHACSDEEIMKEFNILKELDHPNILKQIEMFCDDDNYYIVTEICRGGELLDEIQAWGNFCEEDAAELMRHLLGAVNYCHNHNVVHRDLKPENILLEENRDLDSIKIIDFGLAKAIVDHNTVMTDIAGSIYYIAPEVLQGSHTSKADIWSLGVIAFVLIGGYAPFDGHSDSDIKEEILSGEFSFEEDEIWDEVSEQAKCFISSLLELDPADRLTAEEALQHPWIVQTRAASSERLKLRESVNQRAMEALYNLERFNAQSKLKQATCAFIASQLVLKEEKKRIDELFRALDVSSNGKLTKEDVRVGYKQVFGHDLEPETVDQMFQRIDYDSTGYIEYSEFVIATMNEKDLLSNQKLKHAFDMFDVDGSGVISRDELVEVLSYFQSVDRTLDSEVINRIIRQVDTDNDGAIDFEEFTAMMFKTAEDACEDEERSKRDLMDGSAASFANQEHHDENFPRQSDIVPLSPTKKKDSIASTTSTQSVRNSANSVRSSAQSARSSANSLRSSTHSTKACMALFERNKENGVEPSNHHFRSSGGSTTAPPLARLSTRLSFGKIQKRNSKEVVRKTTPVPVNGMDLRSSRHAMRSSHLTQSTTSSSSTGHHHQTARAMAAMLEEQIQEETANTGGGVIATAVASG